MRYKLILNGKNWKCNKNIVSISNGYSIARQLYNKKYIGGMLNDIEGEMIEYKLNFKYESIWDLNKQTLTILSK